MKTQREIDFLEAVDKPKVFTHHEWTQVLKVLEITDRYTINGVLDACKALSLAVPDNYIMEISKSVWYQRNS